MEIQKNPDQPKERKSDACRLGTRVFGRGVRLLLDARSMDGRVKAAQR